MKLYKLSVLLLGIAILIIAIDVLLINIKLNNKIKDLENEIYKIKLDYQFLDYNSRELLERKYVK